MTLLRNGRIKDDVISIHIPRGGMTIQEIKLDFRIVFQSTSPVGG